MYIPKNHFTPDLFTDGSAFVDNKGKSFNGFYFSTIYGTYYKGKNPYDKSYNSSLRDRQIFLKSEQSDGTHSNIGPSYPTKLSTELIDYGSNTNNKKISSRGGDGYYQNFSDIDLYQDNEFLASVYKGGGPRDTPSYIPVSREVLPIKHDYTNGFFVRYFCVKANEDIYYEIDKQTYDDIISNKPGWTSYMYIPFKLLWYIKGERDRIERLNKELIIQAENKLGRLGLNNFLRNEYLKYYRILPGINMINNSGLRNHLDNSPINLRLPKVYQLGNDITYTQNPNVPAKQNCGNCIFNQTQFCSKWKAKIQNNYWCAAYKGKYGEGKVLGEVQDISLPPPTPPTQPSYTPPSSPSPSSGGGGGY